MGQAHINKKHFCGKCDTLMGGERGTRYTGSKIKTMDDNRVAPIIGSTAIVSD